jgi:selenocysteine lyase/cysteine desulfurase
MSMPVPSPIVPSPIGYDVEALRAAEFPWAARGESVYLNNASTGPLPARAVRAIGDWVQRRAEPFRLRDAELVGLLARARALCATLIGAEATEVALMTNTSYGINVAARVLPLQSGDVVLTFAGEFPANVYPWMALAEHGVRLEMVPLRDGLPDEEALLRALERPEVRAVTVSWVQFASGYRVDLARLGAALPRARRLVRGRRHPGTRPVHARRARAARIDLLACGPQKWLLRLGLGLLYVRRELIARLVPERVGWLAFSGATTSRADDYDDYRDDARRFEVATIRTRTCRLVRGQPVAAHELGPAAWARTSRARDRIVAWRRRGRRAAGDPGRSRAPRRHRERGATRSRRRRGPAARGRHRALGARGGGPALPARLQYARRGRPRARRAGRLTGRAATRPVPADSAAGAFPIDPHEDSR